MRALRTSVHASHDSLLVDTQPCHVRLSNCTRRDGSQPPPRRRAPLQRRRSLDPSQESADLSTQFAAFVNREGIREPLKDRRPTPLLSPSAAIAAQMDALHRGDWPDAGAGLRAAFAFSKPHGCEELMAGRPQVFNTHARSWGAAETWLSFDQFSAELHAAPYCLLLNCDSWKPASRLVFPSARLSNRAIQTVLISTTRTLQPGAGVAVGGLDFQGAASTTPPTPASRPKGLDEYGMAPKAREYRFTFCMERIDVGAYKGCWLTIGVRRGDYGNV